jgi:molybdopterin molybdotransferase
VDLFLQHTSVIEETRLVPLSRALGLVCGEAVIAPFDNPPFDRSPLDGFALRSKDSRAATPEK